MDLNTIIKKRYSERSFTSESVSIELINKVIAAGLEAPNSCNMQTTHFIVLTDDELRAVLAPIVTQKLNWAPVNIFLLHDTRLTRSRSSGLVSLGAVMQNMLLTATSLGLATCPMAGFSGDKYLRKMWGIPAYFDISVIIALGYPKSSPRARERLPQDLFVHFNAFDKHKNLLRVDRNLMPWSLKDIMAYRQRIAPVYRYGSRFSLATYRPEEYLSLARRVGRLIADNQSSIVLDLHTYDGLFLKELTKEVPVSVEFLTADLLPYTLKENSSIAENISGVNIDEGGVIDAANDSTDIVTCIHKIEFTPHPEQIFTESNRILRKGGLLVVTSHSETRFKITVRWLLFLYSKFVQRHVHNVYESSRFYKIGPHAMLSNSYIKNLAGQFNFEEVLIKQYDEGNGITYSYAIYKKL